MDTTEITKYLDMASRRRFWIIIPFLVTLLGGLVYILVAPRMYQAETLILVQPQSVPETFVQAIVSESVDERLKTITQQVTSRTNLERIIKEFALDEDYALSGLALEDRVRLIRERVNIQLNLGGRRGASRGGEGGISTFSIEFTWEEPQKAMQVANALASNFISENLRVRESQALGTSSFLSEELASIEKRLKEKEEELKTYREKYMGGLPGQLDANLRVIEGLRAQLDRVYASLRDRESRRALLQAELAGQTEGTVVSLAPSGQGRAGEEVRDLPSLKSELAALETKYTPNHPDIIRLKALIQNLEKKESERALETSGTSASVAPANRRAVEELSSVEAEIRSLKVESERINDQIKMHQKWVDETPRREQELFASNRDYDRLKELHSSLLKRKLEAEIAVSLEKKQKGEQFRVIDPAKVPMRPIKPDMKKAMLAILALGLGFGCGLAYVREMMDTSYRSPEEIEKELRLPVLVSVPIRYTKAEIRRRKAKGVLKAASVGVGFAVGAVAIVVAAKGFDKTLSYLKSLIGMS